MVKLLALFLILVPILSSYLKYRHCQALDTPDSYFEEVKKEYASSFGRDKGFDELKKMKKEND